MLHLGATTSYSWKSISPKLFSLGRTKLNLHRIGQKCFYLSLSSFWALLHVSSSQKKFLSGPGLSLMDLSDGHESNFLSTSRSIYPSPNLLFKSKKWECHPMRRRFMKQHDRLECTFFTQGLFSAFVLFWTNGENGATTFWIKNTSEMNDVLVLLG